MKSAQVIEYLGDNNSLGLPHVRVTYHGAKRTATLDQTNSIFSVPRVGSYGIIYRRSNDESDLGFISADYKGKVNINLSGAQPGDVFVASTVSGSYVKILSDGEIEVHAKNGKVLIGGNDIELNAVSSISITSPSLTHNGVNIGSTHTHGGVETGGGNTGGPQ